MTAKSKRQTADEMLGRDRLIRLHALNLAVGQRREVFRVVRTDDERAPYGGEFAREALVDARLYAAWLRDGDPAETPEESAAIVHANLQADGSAGLVG